MQRYARRWSVTLAVVLAVALVLVAGCSNESEPVDEPDTGAEEPRSVGERLDFVWADRDDPVWLNPLLEKSGDDIRNNRLIFDRLFVFDGKAQPVAQLAEGYEISDDGMTYTVTLKEGVLWHDGETFTADDVVYTYEKAMDPTVACRYASNMWALAGYDELRDENNPKTLDQLETRPVVAIDDYTVQFNLTTPYAPFVANVLTSPAIVPAHLLEGETDLTEAAFNQEPVGTGPFAFKEWKRDDYIALVAFDDYYQGKPKVKSITNRLIPDAAVGAMELKSGGIHYRPTAKLENYEMFKNDPNFETLSEVGFSYSTLSFVNDREPWNDRRVREAIAYGINLKEAVDKYVGDLGMLLGTPIPPSSWAHNPNLEPRPFDQDKALELLNEAGWSLDDEGVLRNADGEQFHFALETFNGVERADMNVIFQENLRHLGMEVEVHELATADLLNKMHGAEHSDAIFITWGMSKDPDAEMFRRFHSSEMDWNNFYHYSNSEVDALLEEARFELDQEKRQSLYFQVQEILHRDVPGVFAFTKKSTAAYTPRLKGITWGADGWFDFAHLIELEPEQ